METEHELRIVGVSGGRDRKHGSLPAEVICRALYDFHHTPNGHSNFTHLLVGALMPMQPDNTDTIAAQWALSHEISIIVEPAWWLRLKGKKAAGHMRNERMLQNWDQQAESVVLQAWLFFPGTEGTHDMFNRVRTSALPHYAYSTHEGWLFEPARLPWEP